jgi:hypothetical protein
VRLETQVRIILGILAVLVVANVIALIWRVVS